MAAIEPMRILLLGTAAEHRERLTAELDFPHRLEAVVDAETLPARTRAEVVITMQLQRPTAERVDFRLLQLPGAGLDGIDFAALPPAVWVCNVYEHEVPIAEYVMLAMLETTVGFCAMTSSFRATNWAQAYRTRALHNELAGKTVGVLGFGHIGREVATRARAFGMRVAAVSRSVPASELVDWAAPVAQLHEMLAQADFVLIACALNAQTRGLIDGAALAAMKPSAVLINVARAEVVAEEALYRVLAERRIGGAILDVWYRYPAAGETRTLPASFPFEELPNVRCTPHSSALTAELWERRFCFIARNLARWHRGEPLANVVREPGEVVP